MNRNRCKTRHSGLRLLDPRAWSVLLALLACEEKTESSLQEQTVAVEAYSIGNATITGEIVLIGEPPQPLKVSLAGDTSCQEHYNAHSMEVTSARTGVNGALQDVFVYIKSGLGETPFKVPVEPVVLDQVGCIFTPRVFGIMAQQKLEVRNSDPTLHNVHAGGKQRGNSWNFGLPKKDTKRIRQLEKSEVMVQIKCDVHPWMRSFAGVMTHPYFAVTGADGKFALNHLPKGTFVLAIWHELFGEQEQTVTVDSAGAQRARFEYPAVEARD